MKLKVEKSQGSPTRTTSSLDLFEGVKLATDVKDKIRNDVGDFLLESIRLKLANAQSPIAGEKFPKLSPDYKKHKLDESLPGIPNMEFSGDMLDSLEYKSTATGIEIGFFNSEAWKADGHLKFSGETNHLPKRRFLPDEGQEFIPAIQKEVGKIIADAITSETDFDKKDFETVGTKTDLFEALSEYFPELTRAEMRSVVSRTPKLTRLLDDLGLLDLL